MTQKRLFSSINAGTDPETLVHVGDQKIDDIKISVIDYDNLGHYSEQKIVDIAQLSTAKEGETVTWINVAGLHQVEVIKSIGKVFGIHHLLLEDILNTTQRPKIEQYDSYLYLIIKLFDWHEEKGEIEVEQISIVLGDRFILTFEEGEDDVFDLVRHRVGNNGRIRHTGADYLAYSLLDTIVDRYFLILEKLGEQIELVEEELLAEPDKKTLQKIHGLKREMLLFRRSVWPLRELIGGLQRSESTLFQESTMIYLRDLYEHTIQIIDTIETYRDIVSGLIDIYLSSVSNKMNEVMKVLTIIATIFIPLTFITSLYGMNFKYMPELTWHWGYPLVWGIILLLSAAMIFFFRWRKWL
jgi:magnesium transporter